MIANYRDELIWRVMRGAPAPDRGPETRRFHGRVAGPGRMILSRREALAATALAPLAIAGCARRPHSGLDFWAMGAEAENMPALLSALPRTGLPSVRVQPLPWSAAHEKLLTCFAGSSLPDLGQVGNSWIAELTAIGAIEPVPAGLEAWSLASSPASSIPTASTDG